MKRIAILRGLLALFSLPAAAQISIPELDEDFPHYVARTPPRPGVAPTTEHLFGDWGGLRTTLANIGIYVGFDPLTEFASNVSGGTKQGAMFAGQEALSLDIDWQCLAGFEGFSSHMIMVNRWGANDSTLFGDHLLPVQEIYGAGGDVAAHLVSAYAQEKLFGGMIDLAAGRMNVCG